jgi:glycosyltransferase involved in cell wall biosynthesis
MSISVLILTLNEETNLPRCLESVRWSDDVVVFDSHSSDATLEIARASGARVFTRRFDNERDHRAASLRVGFKYPWVYNPDADEIAENALAREMLDVVARPGLAEVAFRMRRKDMFMGRWLRHSSLYPTWLMRLFRPEALRFERTINLRYVVNGPEGRLRHHIVHHSFGKGLEPWFDKHNRYSSAEAREALENLGGDGLPLRGLLCRDAVERRRALKELWFHLPCRPMARFLYTFLFRGGFLDGAAGFTYARLMSFYEYMIDLKARELLAGQNCQRGHEHSVDQPAVLS